MRCTFHDSFAAVALVLTLFAPGCGSSTGAVTNGPLFVAEGVHHFTAMTVFPVQGESETARQQAVIRTGMQTMRATPGNLAVSLLRRNRGDGIELALISEWRSQSDARQCSRNPDCAALLDGRTVQEFEVLFEATQFEVVP